MAKDAKKGARRDPSHGKSKKAPKKVRSAAEGRAPDTPDGPGGHVTDDRPAIVLVADIALFAVDGGRLVVLLVERQRDPDVGRWALPGAVIEAHETVDEAGRRALVARTGILEAPSRIEHLGVFDSPGRDPRTRVISTGLLAVARRAVPPVGGELASGRWWPVDALDATDGPVLAFDHADIAAAAVDALRTRFEHGDLATAFVEEPFTLGDLRRTYDVVWGTELEPANFRRKILTTPGFVVPHGGTRTVGTGRPADLYRGGPGATLYPPIPRPR